MTRAIETRNAPSHAPSLDPVADGVRQGRLSLGERVAGRYEVRHLLGRGGMGEVYAAFDAVLERVVAIKVLLAGAFVDDRAVGRFLREAKAAARVDHPGCVSIHDYGVDAGRFPYIVMERLAGQTLADRLRRDGPLAPEVAFEIASQVCDTVSAAHARGIVHHDIKPSNLFLQEVVAGHPESVKVLDFGLAAVDVYGGSGPPLRPTGTLPYLAPEGLASPARIGESGDVYAIACVIYEMLIGRPPFTSETRAGLILSIRHDPPPNPCVARPDLALGVGALIQRALAKEPAERPPSVAALAFDLARAGRSVVHTGRVRGPVRVDRVDAQGDLDALPPSPFVGRTDELAALDAASDAAFGGRLLVVRIEGPSGIGKSALLRAFSRGLSARALVLEGRCRESETVSVPALDAAMAALMGRLRTLPKDAVAAIAPRGLSALTRLFPVLAEIEAIAPGRTRHALSRDMDQLRTAAYEALRELLLRLSDLGPLVLALDDAHWLDGDTRALLSYVLREPGAPPLLLVMTARPGEETEAGELAELLGSLPPCEGVLSLSGLSRGDCENLIHQLWRRPDPPSAEVVDLLCARSAGHPLFLSALSQQITTADPFVADLADCLFGSVGSLSEPERRLVDVASLCDRPLPLDVLLEVSRAEPRDAAAPIRSRLLRSLKRGGRQSVEPYHAAVRDAVRSALPPDARRELHLKIAAHVASTDAEAAVEHLAAAGRSREAAQLCSEAAETATGHFAFDRAAALLALGLAQCEPGDPEWLCWTERLAQALHRAGRTYAAGLLLRDAWSRIGPDRGHAIGRRAGELLLLSGDATAGLALLEGALDRHGFTLPSNLEETLGAAAKAYVVLSSRGFEYDDRREDEADPRALEAIDLLLTLAQSLSHIDLRALPLAFGALHQALDRGDLARIQKACAVFVWNTASHMPNDLVDRALALCEKLTPVVSGPYARALLHEARAERFHFATDFLQAEVECERAEHLLVTECNGVGRELAGIRTGAAFVQYSHKGDYASRVEQTLAWMADARMRGDAYHYNMLTAAHAMVWLARDQPALVRDELRAAEARWPGGVGVFEISVVLTLDAVDRYEGSDPSGLRPAQGRSAVLDSPAKETPLVKNYLSIHEGWRALSLLARGGDADVERRRLEEVLAGLRSLGLGVSNAIADAIDGNCAWLEGARERALLLLEQSEHGFRRANMLCLAACARKRRGEFTGGPVGNRIEREADMDLRDLGIKDPDRWSRAYFSPFRIGPEQLLTI